MRSRATAVTLGLVLLACGGGDRAERTRAPSADTIPEAAYTVAADMPPYREIQVTDVGRLEGEVDLESSARDTLVVVTRNADLCGDRIPEGAIVSSQGGLMNVVVWLTDAREGKPLPDSRRFEVTNWRCRLNPRVQGVIVGGTLNVKSADPVVHETVIRVSGSGVPLETVTQNGDGQVVPLPAFRRPAGEEDERPVEEIVADTFAAVLGHAGGTAIDPDLPFGDVSSMQQEMESNVAQPRFRAPSLGDRRAESNVVDKKKQRIWLVIIYLVALVALLRFVPRVGYGVAAITLLALLFRLSKKS